LLRQLVEAHLEKIPFENLAQDGGKGGPVSLDLETIATKILDRNRGGFCFELNALFAALLEDLGYQVTVVPAIVYTDTGFRKPTTHISLAVSVLGEQQQQQQQQQQQKHGW
jgi:N-hydroxyarylamine O-acetyltransferase